MRSASPGSTIVELLATVMYEGQHGGGVVLPGDDAARELRWREVAALACRAADGLARLGVARGERVALAAENSLDWIVADWAVQMLGAVLVPLHVSLSGAQLAWQVSHSGSRLLIVSGQGGCDRLQPATSSLDADLQLVSFSPALDPRDSQPVALWSALLAKGDEAAGRLLWKSTLAAITPGSLASIVYTSGTSGEPRGVMLTQGNLAANAQATIASFGSHPDDCRLSSLPFSHAFGRMSDLYVSLVANTRLALCRARETLIADARQVRPTLLVVVPLLLMRLKQAALTQFGADDREAVQKLLGGNVRGFICGGAALAADTREYLAEQGTPVCEGYGLTEAAPVVFASSTAANKSGSVGRLVPGTMAQIAADGELLISGPQVMAGYWRNEPATRTALQNGWLHTGDLAEIDRDGFLWLHGRKKEFIALTSGKKVWPASIEAAFAGDPLIEQIMLVGEGRPALGALIVPRDRTVANSRHENQVRYLQHLAARLSDRESHEQVRRIALLPEPWTVETGELTPKLTLRRPAILARHANCIADLFRDDDDHGSRSTV